MSQALRMDKSLRKFIEDSQRETVRATNRKAFKKFVAETAKFNAALVAGLNKGVMKDNEPE